MTAYAERAGGADGGRGKTWLTTRDLTARAERHPTGRAGAADGGPGKTWLTMRDLTARAERHLRRHDRERW